MSKSKLTDILPPNALLFPDAEADIEALDKSRRILVIKAITKIAENPSTYGKPLEHQEGRNLTGFRSAYVDAKRVRIIWRPLENGQMEIMVVAAVGVRDKMEVYKTAVNRRERLEEWIKRVVQADIKKGLA